MEDNDDDKTDLDRSTILKAVKLFGGKTVWVLIIVSFGLTNVISKFRDFQVKNISSQ